ncbi:MAG: glutamate--tRNA ligase [Anaerolineales bacterium]
MMDSIPARVRFAPSPTGRMHLGSARTALYDYLLARRTGGKFILRIEDTDRKRFVPGAEQELIDGLRWLGLDFDEGPDIGGSYGPYRQTERQESYRKWAGELIERGHAYYCFCAPERLEKVRQEQQKNKQPYRYDGACLQLDPDEARRRVAAGEKHVVRFKMPREGQTKAVDQMRGEIVWQNTELDDSIIIKSDGLPTYHLAATADDYEMKITHVIRGSEWLSSFPLHVNIIRALDWPEPVWMHLSVFLKPSGKGKMSKREAAQAVSDGHSIFVTDLQALGYIPAGVLNWIVLMGWGVAEDDVMTLDQMVQRFDIDHLTASPAAINFAKLDHFNGTHIRLLAADDLAARVKPFFTQAGFVVDDDLLLKIIPLIRERLVTLDDAIPFAGFFFNPTVNPAPDDLVAKGLTAPQSAEIARKAYDILEKLPALIHAEAEPPMRQYVEESGLQANQVFGILRVAVTGQKVSPPLFESMEIIGREKVLERIKAAIEILSK